VYRVLIGGPICFPLQGAAWGLFDLLSGFHLNLLQYKWFLRDVRGVCEIVQAMNFSIRFKDSPFTWTQTLHRDAFSFLVQMADQIDWSTIIIVRCEAKFPIKSLIFWRQMTSSEKKSIFSEER
jgi:hypothetical protein